MLLLQFRLHGDRFAIDARQVVEVLPLVDVRPVPLGPRGVAGIFSYRGAPVPVIDLSDLLLGQPSPPRLSTRLIVVRYPITGNEAGLLGLVAEHATETVRRPQEDFVPSGVASRATPGLGPVATDAHGMLQLLDLTTLLPPVLRDSLFARGVEA